MFKQQLEFAAGAVAGGKLAAAEIVCRDILDVDPENVAALNLLGIVAAKVGANDHSKAYFTAALRIEPNNERVRGNLNLLMTVPAPQSVGGPANRYLLIKSWGYGFWSDVSQVLGNLLLAEVTGRTPVTHWGKNSLFSDGSSGDAFKLYFEPVSKLNLDEPSRVGNATFFPSKWSADNLACDDVAKWHGHGSRATALDFLNRPETIAVSDFYIGVIDVAPWIPAQHPMHRKPLDEIYRYLIRKYLVPGNATRQSCDAFFGRYLRGQPFVAVHMRGSDKMEEDEDLHATNEACLSAIASIDRSLTIFLLTDDEPVRQRMASIYGSRIITTECQRTSTSTGVHYLPSINRVQAGFEIMTDTYLALRASGFIGNGRSNVSAMIDVLKHWKPGESTLIGRSALTKRNLFLHLRQ